MMKKYLPFIIFLAVLGLYSIKAGTFSIWHDEMSTVAASSLSHAMNLARQDVVPPFFFVINAIFKAGFSGSIYFQKLPHILTAALWVVLFYQILRYFQFKKPLLFTVLVATSFILIFFAQDIHPYSYYLLLTLVSLFYGYKVFVEEKVNFTDFVWLSFAFLILPLDHYFAFFHLLVLDLSLLIFILIFSQGKRLLKIGQLALLNGFIFLGLIPWLDYFQKIFGSPPGENKIYRFDIEMLRNILYKFSGGSDIWSLTIFLVFLLIIVWQIKGLFVKGAWQNSLTAGEKFTIFLILYLFIFALIIPAFPFKRFLFWRYFLFLIWPFFFILASGFNQAIEFKDKVIPLVANALLLLFIVSNVINSGAYFLAPHRFSDWQEMASQITLIAKERNKNRIILNNQINPEDLKFYLQDKNLKIESLSDPSRPVSARDNLSDSISCCSGEIIYIHAEDSLKMRDNAILQRDTEEIRNKANESFSNKIIIWDNPFNNFLTARKVSPFWNYTIDQGGYFKPVIYFQ